VAKHQSSNQPLYMLSMVLVHTHGASWGTDYLGKRAKHNKVRLLLLNPRFDIESIDILKMRQHLFVVR